MASKLFNPLRNAEALVTAAMVYQEIVAYGPGRLRDVTGSTGSFSSFVAWKIADPAYTQAIAVWDGKLYIARDETPTALEADKLVTLALELQDADLVMPLNMRIARAGAPVPTYAFYTNIQYSTLKARIEALRNHDLRKEEINKFLDLTLVGTGLAAWNAVPVRAGSVIGDIGQVSTSGGLAPVLEFQMSLSPSGETIYPAALFSAAGQAGEATADQLGPQSIWSITSKRILVRLRDEWNEPLGVNSSGQILVSRIANGTVAESMAESVSPGSGNPDFAFAASWLGANPTRIRLAVDTSVGGQSRSMLLSAVISLPVPAFTQIELDLRAPAELNVQALDAEAWFPAQGGKTVSATGQVVDVQLPAAYRLARYTNGNKITPLIDGKEYYKDLIQELSKLSDGSHFLCHANWWFDHELALIQDHDYGRLYPQDQHTIYEDTRIIDYWERIKNTVPIRGLFNSFIGGPHLKVQEALPVSHPITIILNSGLPYQYLLRFLFDELNQRGNLPLVPNDQATEYLNSNIPQGQAIFDARYRPLASHHQKYAVLKNSDGLVAYVGGIDIKSNRVNSADHDNFAQSKGFNRLGPYHDVHCKIEGPAANDVLRSFIFRWNDHPKLSIPDTKTNGKKGNIACPDLGITPGVSDTKFILAQSEVRSGGTNLVQIACTYGNCGGLKDSPIASGGTFTTNSGYAFAPEGDFTLESTIINAIHRARKFVYIEDQYVSNMKIAVALAERIREMKAAGKPFFVFIIMPYFDRRSIYDATPYESITSLFLPEGFELPELTYLDNSWAYTMSRWRDVFNSVDPNGDFWGLFNIALPKYQVWKPEIGMTATAAGPVLVKRPKLQDAELAERLIYVHAKTTIVDDIWATIGSANLSIRSFTYDSEMNVSFIDGQVDEYGRRYSVRQYRARLWAEHLGLPFGEIIRHDGNSRWAIRSWRSIGTASPLLGLRNPNTSGGSGYKPKGNRVYRWPGMSEGREPSRQGKAYVQRNQTLKLVLRKKDGTSPYPILPPANVSDIPMPFFVFDPFGKLAWSPLSVETDIKPPAIGSKHFTFDGQAGNGQGGDDYRDFDIASTETQE